MVEAANFEQLADDVASLLGLTDFEARKGTDEQYFYGEEEPYDFAVSIAEGDPQFETVLARMEAFVAVRSDLGLVATANQLFFEPLKGYRRAVDAIGGNRAWRWIISHKGWAGNAEFDGFEQINLTEEGAEWFLKVIEDGLKAVE